MSVYASTMQCENEYGSFRKPVLSKERVLGIAEAKRKMLRKEFHLGAEHDGNLDEMVITGENVLRKEIKCARNIPAEDRVLVRRDESLMELHSLDEGSVDGEEGVPQTKEAEREMLNAMFIPSPMASNR